MKFLKVIFIILGIVLILGAFYGVAMLGPGGKMEDDYVYVDPDADARAILMESESLEAEFEKAAAVSQNVPDEAIEKLKKAIALQEIYISKSRTMDRTPAERLMKLQVRLNDVEAMPFAEKLASVEASAIKFEEAGEFDKALEAFREAFDLQSKINNDFPQSSYKDIRKLVRFDREVKMLQARPLYMESMEHENAANKALEDKDWTKARVELEKTIEILVRLNSLYPTSVYTDFARMQKLDVELESLKSTELQLKIENFEKKAAELESKGEFLAASEAYSDAEETQRSLNKLFPKSRHASEEKLSDFNRKKEDTYSWKFAKEILNQEEQMESALLKGEVRDAVEISGNLIRKVEQFKSDFPRSQIIPSDMILRLRYINYMSKDIAKIQKMVLEDLRDINGVKMLKHEVSQELFKLVMQENPSRNSESAGNPVDSVTFDDATRFCTRLSWILAKDVSLPSKKVFADAIGELRYVNLDELSWNNMNSGGKTHAVGSKKPNDKGFYDLLGNVAEYVISDNSDDRFALTMGGSAQTSTDEMLDLAVVQVDSRQRNRMVGFRIVVGDKSDKK